MVGHNLLERYEMQKENELSEYLQLYQLYPLYPSYIYMLLHKTRLYVY